ncbi:type I-MYXAN CRISPR-associated Cas8a1/Cmx1 [Coleofasciculus sp. FACHB-64]|uniref:type I-MYXAN CRISPR-associated Cas8a1/Cmx1 n=1 Tax=Cyanophyceae TaxID=3028117 RepID=UPI0019B00817|nr:type I-MYXAN CRISPR-associated Cas8a1/Cmx1 [Coleofasciculus sp. FACHB-64]MBD2044137.1 type I-MYXAN CRISPR-associated Cas8a1/Cmx1 [Coleofasciculus sp. FACHB-64]
MVLAESKKWVVEYSCQLKKGHSIANARKQMKRAANPKIQLNLGDPSITLLHRAGMAGLWMTLKKLKQIYPTPAQRIGRLTWQLTPCSISLDWEGQDFTVLDWLLKQSFQISDEGLISLTGLNPEKMDIQTKIIIHQGITETFTQHNKFFKSAGQEFKQLTIDGVELRVDYKKAAWYAHQHFAKYLCDQYGQLLQELVGITGWLYPGAVVRHYAFQKETKFEEKTEHALALLFAPVACQYFAIRAHTNPQDTKYVLVVPEVIDLELCAQYFWSLNNLNYKDFHVSSLGDAGLKFLTYETTQQATSNFIKRCQAISFSTVPWSKQQKTRTEIVFIELNSSVSSLYKLSCICFSKYQLVFYKNQLFILSSLVKGIIANNLVMGFPWWTNFSLKIKNNKLFQENVHDYIGIYQMIQQYEWDIEAQKLFVKACHEALQKIYTKIYSRTKEGEYAQIERENTRILSQLRRCTNAGNFRKFIAEFWATAGQISILEEHWAELLPLTTGMGNWKVARDLTFIAIASYPRSKTKETELLKTSELNAE